MATRAWKVRETNGHRIKESFNPSVTYDWMNENRKIEILNSDITGTNEYSIIVITRDTDDECVEELEGQLSDGIYENCNSGYPEEIPVSDIESWRNNG